MHEFISGFCLQDTRERIEQSFDLHKIMYCSELKMCANEVVVMEYEGVRMGR